jgi:hypothetical protein
MPASAGPWALFYAASTNANNYNIGVAFSSTPTVYTSWVDYGGNPLLATGQNYADPCVRPHPTIPGGFIMYAISEYPANAGFPYFVNSSGDGVTWTYGGQYFVQVSGKPSYGLHSLFEPTVWKNNYCFWEMMMDFEDIHNSLGSGVSNSLYAISPDGITFTEDDEFIPQLFGVANPRVNLINGQIYVHTDINPDFSAVITGGAGLMSMPDVA